MGLHNDPLSGMPGVSPPAATMAPPETGIGVPPNAQVPPGMPMAPPASSTLGGGAPRSLPTPPAAGSFSQVPPGANTLVPSAIVPGTPVPSPSDLSPMPRPQLGGGFANVANCNLVTPPSSYTAAAGVGCGVAPAGYNSTPYVPPPLQIPTPATMPTSNVPAAGVPLAQAQGGAVQPSATGSTIPPLVQFGQQKNQVQIGQGLWGQPKAYVPGQKFRNGLRYLFP